MGKYWWGVMIPPVLMGSKILPLRFDPSIFDSIFDNRGAADGAIRISQPKGTTIASGRPDVNKPCKTGSTSTRLGVPVALRRQSRAVKTPILEMTCISDVLFVGDIGAILMAASVDSEPLLTSLLCSNPGVTQRFVSQKNGFDCRVQRRKARSASCACIAS
jgi:hypothetical protein